MSEKTGMSAYLSLSLHLFNSPSDSPSVLLCLHLESMILLLGHTAED
jgi:hypothetical protein